MSGLIKMGRLNVPFFERMLRTYTILINFTGIGLG